MEQGDVAGGLVTEAEVGTDHDRRGVQRLDQDLLDEPLRRPPGHLVGERDDQPVVGAGRVGLHGVPVGHVDHDGVHAGHLGRGRRQSRGVHIAARHPRPAPAEFDGEGLAALAATFVAFSPGAAFLAVGLDRIVSLLACAAVAAVARPTRAILNNRSHATT